jgi:sialic acid synthase SpsE
LTSFAARFDCPVGFSDHTLGQTTAVASVGLGASFFEKHFTLDRSSEGPDHFYAMEPDELTQYVSSLHEAHSAMGNATKELLPQERKIGRREGLYLKHSVKAGEIISAENLIEKRPAIGLRSRYRNAVIGATAIKDMDSDHPLTWNDLQF